jgi:hypothetical protein
MTDLSSKVSETITSNPTESNVFHDVEIDSMRFNGYVGCNGPCIMNVSSKSLDGDKFVQLGVAEIHYCSSRPDDNGTGWWICKYGPDEPRINIDSLTDEGRHSLAFEFGIPLYPQIRPKDAPKYGEHYLPGGQHLFYLSPSFKTLCNWALSHKKQIRSKDIGEAHLRGWKEAVFMGDHSLSMHSRQLPPSI